VFASGEAAERADHPYTRHTAQALRAAPVLAHNLLAAHEGRALKPHWPAQTLRTFVACGATHAVMAWGPWHLRGGWVRYWKGRVDRRLTAAAERGQAAAGAAHTPHPGEVRRQR
jgi:selenide,water dikinase